MSDGNKKKKKISFVFLFLIIGLIVSVAFFCIALYHIVLWYMDHNSIKNMENELNSIIEVVEKDNSSDNCIWIGNDNNDDYKRYVKVPSIEVDFTKLLERNADTVAYIKVNNTNIDYPVVQRGDNDYYLTHAYDNSYNLAGWVFSDYRNNLDELNSNTVFYGHGRVDGTMFGSLKNVLDSDWQSNLDNYIIRVSTPKNNYVFQIFSVYKIQSEVYYMQTEFSTEDEKQQWINTMIERNVMSNKTDVSINDSFLTLSTCSNNNDQRIVVHAKLIKKCER